MDTLTQLALAHTLPGVHHKVLRHLWHHPDLLHHLLHRPTPALIQACGIRSHYSQRLLDTVRPGWEVPYHQLITQHHIHITPIHLHSHLRILEHSNPATFLLYSTQPLQWTQPLVAIVGARAMSPYGQEVTRYFTRHLVTEGFTIISGFAYGVDQEAHNTAEKYGGHSIGVLGCGLDLGLRTPPPSALTLCSELPLGTAPTRYTFPQRNRIISALAGGVLVVEAKERSGTIITAHYALEQGKYLWIVPGDIFSQHLSGGHQLLRDHLGEAVFHPTQLIEHLKNSPPSALGQYILHHLHTPLPLELLATRTNIELDLLRTEVETLEHTGYIYHHQHCYHKKI